MNDEPQKVKRTTAGLRDALFDALDEIRQGGTQAVAKAKAVAAVSQQIINVAKAEMDFHQRMNKDPQLCDDFMTGKLELGSKIDQKRVTNGA